MLFEGLIFEVGCAAAGQSRARRRRLKLQTTNLKQQGYSFPEVLFAVVVLGIGFIMIAAIFPAAISQSKSTMDETNATVIARTAVNLLTPMVNDRRLTTPPLPLGMVRATGETSPTFPGHVRGFDTAFAWESIRGSLIFADDPRYAFVLLYRRNGLITDIVAVPPRTTWSSDAQLYVIVVQCRTLERPVTPNMLVLGQSNVTVPGRTELMFDQYDYGLDVAAVTGPPLAVHNPNNLGVRQIKIVRLTDNDANSGTDVLRVDPTTVYSPGDPNAYTPGSANAENLPEAIAEGAYLIVRQNGKIYRIGSRRTDLDVAGVSEAWELQPGGDMQSSAEDLPTPPLPTPPTPNPVGYVVGRERVPVAAGGTPKFIGPAQDVAIYTTYLTVNP